MSMVLLTWVLAACYTGGSDFDAIIPDRAKESLPRRVRVALIRNSVLDDREKGRRLIALIRVDMGPEGVRAVVDDVAEVRGRGPGYLTEYYPKYGIIVEYSPQLKVQRALGPVGFPLPSEGGKH